MSTDVLFEAKRIEPGPGETTQFTATSRTAIDSFSACNPAAFAVIITVKLVPSGATPGAEHTLAVQSIAAGASYGFPELVGQVLNAGDFISTTTNAVGADNIVARASGRVF